ncbi:MAG: fibronectin type III domain-containing protein, partial [Lachnospiraceae bacterium]|nr:fibronectin type III domain-containing protein [Lachnospiraceae bacterium]
DKGTITLQNRKSAVSKITFSPKTSAIASYSIENNTVTVKGKKAGKFTLVVTDPETANYKASKPKSILITVSKPTKPAIQNPVTSSRAVTAKWRRVANATGYYVQIATNTGFTKGVKNKVITKNTTITNKFTGLKKGTTYYVRVYSYVGSYTAANRSAVSATRRITCK